MMKVTIKTKDKKHDLDATGLVLFLACILASPVVLIVYGFGWVGCTFIAVALTGLIHYFVLNVVDLMRKPKKDSQDLQGS